MVGRKDRMYDSICVGSIICGAVFGVILSIIFGGMDDRKDK